MKAGLAYAERQAFLSLEFRYGKSGDPALFEFWRAETRPLDVTETNAKTKQSHKGAFSNLKKLSKFCMNSCAFYDFL